MCDSWVIVNNNRPRYLNVLDRGTRKGTVETETSFLEAKLKKSDVTQNFNFGKN